MLISHNIYIYMPWFPCKISPYKWLWPQFLIYICYNKRLVPTPQEICHLTHFSVISASTQYFIKKLGSDLFWTFADRKKGKLFFYKSPFKKNYFLFLLISMFLQSRKQWYLHLITKTLLLHLDSQRQTCMHTCMWENILAKRKLQIIFKNL